MKSHNVVAVAALAAGALCLESTLSRLLAVAQFYHFAFLVISLALLGFAASGTLLSLSPRLRSTPVRSVLASCAAAFALSVLAAYLVVNFLPFDSFSLFIDQRQWAYFILYYLALSLPFLFSGLGIAAALSDAGGRSHWVYAANLLGSAGGIILALLLLNLAGVPGAVVGSMLVGILPALPGRISGSSKPGWARCTAWITLLTGIPVLIWLGVANWGWRAPLGLRISPYKSLSYARQYPGARIISGRWSAISRLDLVADAGTRLLPGLSYTYPQTPPDQLGLSLDAGALTPVTLVEQEDFPAAEYLPEAIAFRLRQGKQALVLEPAGGLGILQALAGGAAGVTVAQPDALIPKLLDRSAPEFNPYLDERVQLYAVTSRAYLDQAAEYFGLIYLPLTDAFQPVTSGAYSLQETYALTVEMFARALARLEPDGILAATRWLQTPPSESLRLLATLVEALERNEAADPAQALAAYRGVQTLTVLVQPDGWSPEELADIRSFTAERRYDLVWAPDIRLEETNRYNKLPAPEDYLALKSLLNAPDRDRYFSSYPFDVRPVPDNRPFFFHFFTWKQIPEILSSLGRTWQPFGGSGFLVMLGLLLLVVLLSAGLVIAPLTVPAQRARLVMHGEAAQILLYFCLIGAAYLLVEIPLIQRWILLLGHPTYAFSAVVLVLLFCSGVGSLFARAAWLPKRAALGGLVAWAVLTPLLTAWLTSSALGWTPLGRSAAAILALIPLGLLMGLPFPLGLEFMETRLPAWIPWAWAVNGCASVIASVAAAILALTVGFNLVLWTGAAAYAGAWGIYLVWRRTFMARCA
jgi:hypothetical protein